MLPLFGTSCWGHVAFQIKFGLFTVRVSMCLVMCFDVGFKGLCKIRW